MGLRPLTIEAAAREAGVSTRTINRYVKNGTLESRKFNGQREIDRESFARWVASRRYGNAERAEATTARFEMVRALYHDLSRDALISTGRAATDFLEAYEFARQHPEHADAKGFALTAEANLRNALDKLSAARRVRNELVRVARELRRASSDVDDLISEFEAELTEATSN